MLNDAAYMMSVEKNTDLVKMASYAPLLENVNDRDWEVNMIHFDSSRAFARATYYVNKLFAENLPTVNLETAVEHRPTASKPIAAKVGVGTQDTSAEFKDVVIERDGRVLFRSDFSTASGWTPEGRRGKWGVTDGAYRQARMRSPGRAFPRLVEPTTRVTLKARKISGAKASSFPSASRTAAACSGTSAAGATRSMPCRRRTPSSARRRPARSRPAAGTT